MSRRPKEKTFNNPVWMVSHEEHGWRGGTIVLGVCDSYRNAMNLLHEVIEQKVLEDYASFEFLRLRRCYSDTELTEYVAVYKEEDCHFSIAKIELNSLIEQEELDY